MLQINDRLVLSTYCYYFSFLESVALVTHAATSLAFMYTKG